MPRPTFANLPADKRARFVDAALDEFAAHPYAEASVSRIVARLGIAKGSVYQYFDDKADLFCWLVAEYGRRKADLAGSVSAGGSIWARLAATYRAGLAEWQTDPRWARVGLRALEPCPEPRVDALRVGYEQAITAWLTELLREGQRAGDVRADLDLESSVHFVRGVLTTGLLSATFARLGTDLEAWVASPRPVSDGEREALLAIADQAVDLLRRALG
jgi:TetR/AcrR family transcriptional regulator